MSDKLWREVEEILERAERQRPRRPWRRWRETWRRLPRPRLYLPLPRPSVGQVLLVALVVIILGYVLTPSVGDLGRALVLAGIATFLLIFLLSLWRPFRWPERRWRGRPLEMHGQGVGGRLRSWLDRWRGRR
ncbi:MAG: hypothetical protein NZ695_00830 [Dehalococcoidia bacterium]|jgi:hypothetical protein|nr:hypothetical protein [Dehalococcoidia bacterium]MDW8008073.1 hypothetical protein [Chloroflexota bacterium]